jgi:serine/threonine-protein kinase
VGTPSPSNSSSAGSPWHGLLSWTPGASTLGDAREFLQSRVRTYVGFLLALFSTFYVIDSVEQLSELGAKGMVAPGQLAYLALVIALAAAWWLLRRGERSTFVTSTMEVMTTLGISGVAVVMLQTIPADVVAAGPMMAMALALVARASLVPSTGKRTLLVGALVTVTLTVGYLVRPAGDPNFAAFVAVWLTAFSLASALASRVIYGLQQQVRQARQLGQYVLEQRLGEGGMGVVYRASHRLLRRPTAVKLMSSERSHARDVARFEQEVRQTARLRHPNTVTIYDYGRSSDGVFYYAMELLQGSTLEDVVAVGGPLPPARTVAILSAIAGALEEAHGINLIHRDIKPANIMLCELGGQVDVVKVLDFGLVKDLSEDSELTQEGSLTGTPAFMSPETIQDPAHVGPRSDLYALGAVGYYLLTGLNVFEGKSVVEICSHHLLTPPVAPSKRTGRQCPAELEQLLMRCLEKDVDRRPKSADVFRRALSNLSDVGRWTDDAARAWWDEHRSELSERRAPSGELSATLALDLSQRS